MLCCIASCVDAIAATSTTAIVTAPPETFFEIVDEKDRDAAREFYKKYASVDGIPVVAAGSVADQALVRTCEIVNHMLAGRPDIVQQMVKDKMYLIIIGKDQLYCDMPEYRDSPNPAYWNERVRGTGGRPTSFGEENLLSLPLDRYDDESIAVHEFCHTIDGALRDLDPDWRDRLNSVYRSIKSKGLYKDVYAGSNAGEYWAEIGQSYFDCNRVNNWNHGPVGTREQLRVYDPEGYELARSTFQLKPEQDWRYAYLQKHPIVIAPPEKFKVDPYYTKFSLAREFPVVGRGASDEAMLKANDTIRKMFTYRHDVLKALINDGAKLVVLGRDESLADLPEYAALEQSPDFDPLARVLTYSPSVKLLVVGEENVTADPSQPNVGDNQVIRVMADAAYRLTANRPEDPNWNDRKRDVQQYELRVERLDERFGKRIAETHERALKAGKWRGTSAVHEPIGYWTAGLLAYFDAAGQDAAPQDAAHPIRTREELQKYDPDLYAIVDETMAYDGRVDWRFRAGGP
jgi:hypothetical protein